MAVIFGNPQSNPSAHDPLLPWLLSIKKALDELDPDTNSTADLHLILSNCVNTFKQDPKFRNDLRFLKIWFLYLDGCENYEEIFGEMEENKICAGHSLLYELYALFLEAKGKLVDALAIYRLGISRNAEPQERLKKLHSLFLDRMSHIVDACSMQKIDGDESVNLRKHFVNPWSMSTIKDLLKEINPQILKFDGFHSTTKAYTGKVALSSLRNSSRNKIIEIGTRKYQIKGCAGQGGFAQVFKAYVNCNPDEVVALKIQKPPFSWEFYMYRQLDNRIPDKERPSFGFAHRLHLYSNYSILVCDYLANGTLQDAVNSYVVVGGFMEEVLCIYYTIKMLHMLEILHGVGIIHGDFKPDNLLIRYARGDIMEEGFFSEQGPWHDQGLCLVDWGRGIDLSVFPDNTEFTGDCRTSGFRCIEMQENKPWKFQVDLYGLCSVVHLMLHNSYMVIEKKTSPDGGFFYQPKAPFKRYWRVELWKNLFTRLLNMSAGEDHLTLLRNLKESFQDYMGLNPQLIKKLKQLLQKQRASLCSA